MLDIQGHQTQTHVAYVKAMHYFYVKETNVSCLLKQSMLMAIRLGGSNLRQAVRSLVPCDIWCYVPSRPIQ